MAMNTNSTEMVSGIDSFITLVDRRPTCSRLTGYVTYIIAEFKVFKRRGCGLQVSSSAHVQNFSATRNANTEQLQKV